MTARLVVLVSGAGTNLQALLDACADPAYGATVVAVGADRDGIEGLARAERAGIPTFVHPLAGDRAAWDAALADLVAEHTPDLVVSAGFMKLVGSAFLGRFGGRFVNTHPALLPSFPGMHGARDALAHGVRVTGCTLFLVDAGVDTGPIVAQAAVPVRDDDDEASLHERIKVAERAMLVEAVGRMAREGWSVTGRKVTIGMSTETSGPAERAEDGTPAARAVRRALVSVYDKTGLEELARGLAAAGVEIVSTGSTAARIAAAGVPVTAVSDVTGFPETLDGRVKTLHPRVHAGLLADLRRADHVKQLDELGIAPFELVVANLYPFADTVASGAGAEEVVEQIDIGGPSMVRAAAKNHANVAVVVDPAGYPAALDAVHAGGFDLDERRRLAAQAFAHTAAYDVAVARWFAQGLVEEPTGPGTSCWPAFAGTTAERAGVLRYGENPHQAAALYVDRDDAPGIAQAEQLHGKPMSYNNYVDADAAYRAAYDHDGPCVAIVKHTNPCGIAVAPEADADAVALAHRKAHACDPVSAFGGVIAVNRPVSRVMAEQVAEIFTEVVVAPSYEDGAVEVLGRKPSIRVLVAPERERWRAELRQVSGGFLAQTADALDAPGDDPGAWTLACGAPADPATLADLAFAWQAVRSVKSNAILLGSDGATVGVGMGQVNRVDSARLAVARAGERATGSVAASDAFFPFPDGLQVLVDAGVRAVVQPGGSVRDAEVVAAAEAAGVTMYLTATRHFFH
ncbi:MAG TPA: bifunctional phosphoribosylaminoimidazolecarboxamide formyltransferase/IMP cyclohydrolase [Cryptosporangiaceae bacterium]|nr:bifunctional phosphoribosylaminoimidazolecarboxamide formyltransferase/IMP cyclohydrolase [Cryptosporangiaceae bacterium]